MQCDRLTGAQEDGRVTRSDQPSGHCSAEPQGDGDAPSEGLRRPGSGPVGGDSPLHPDQGPGPSRREGTTRSGKRTEDICTNQTGVQLAHPNANRDLLLSLLSCLECGVSLAVAVVSLCDCVQLNLC